MSTADEISVYNSVDVSQVTGETSCYDSNLFPEVIRKKETQFIKRLLQANNPKLILDYGCGGGWLSKTLTNLGFKSVGMDVSTKMMKNAKQACPQADFVVCDGAKLPFKENIFDCVIGISILHHLNLNQALKELTRVSIAKSVFLFMEPNLLNPLSAFGRRIFPMEAHTSGEKPFTPQYLRAALASNFAVEECFGMFFVSFPASRMSKITGLNLPNSIVKVTKVFEDLTEKIPGIRTLNSTIFLVVRRR
jgi:ubiquinone/menaquinone biosynthesis C-methylase UbiE